MDTKITSHIVKGLLISLILILLSIISHITGQDESSWNKWLPTLILIGAIIASCIIYANQMSNNITFGNVFAHGFKVSAVVTCLVIVFTVIFLLITPEIKQKAMEAARTQMQQQGKLSDSDINSWVEKIGSMFYVFAIGFILVFYLFIGVIASLIGAAASKKNPQSPFQQQM